MASLISQLFSSRSSSSIRVPIGKVYDVEDAVEKPARSLKHLLKLNHAEHALHSNTSRSDFIVSYNNVDHLLISAFLFGANEVDLNNLYENESSGLEPWKDSPGEVVGLDWNDYLGKKEYQRAFLDFFEDQLADEGYDWKSVLHSFLFTGEEPLVSSITGNLGQPLVHLGYALKMSSRVMVMEALALAATSYNDNNINKYSDDPSYFKTEPSYKTSSILEIIEKVHADKIFTNNSLMIPGEHNLETIFRDHEAALLDHCNAWAISTNPLMHFRESQAVAAALFVGTGESESKRDLNLLRPLVMSHAILVMLPSVPDKFHIRLVQQWWLTTLAIYIAQLRPEINQDSITSYNIQGKDWAWVAKQAIHGPHATNVRFVEGLHALKEIGETWKDSEDYYLKAAVKFVDEFRA
ncbi:hypothetical protein PISL3812_05306 [Talaromyces islandicus]|uniref:MGS207 protein n=1 Tax=Talaromyces islandicus TaxID=28573 RepID=A0A0U1LY64_TALIS|nr:hypothetical protein PISL3812_05306 [Talaromyces islandicus]